MKISNWTYKGEEVLKIEDFETENPNPFGFVYKISLYELENLKYVYYGRKNLYSKRQKKFGKRELAKMTDKRLKKYRIVEKESDWHTYCSSNKYIKDNKDKYFIKREILHIASSDEELKKEEAKAIICNNGLDDPDCLNSGVSIRYFKKKI